MSKAPMPELHRPSWERLNDEHEGCGVAGTLADVAPITRLGGGCPHDHYTLKARASVAGLAPSWRRQRVAASWLGAYVSPPVLALDEDEMARYRYLALMARLGDNDRRRRARRKAAA